MLDPTSAALTASPVPGRSRAPRPAARLLVCLAASLALAAIAVLALGPQAALLPALALAAIAPRLVAVDLAEHRLPNRLVVPTLALGVVALVAGWIGTGIPPSVPAIAALLVGGGLLVPAALGGIGMGDVKLAAALGLATPTVDLAIMSPLLAFALGGVAAIVVMIRRGRHARLAFGPFLLVGYFAALVMRATVGLLG